LRKKEKAFGLEAQRRGGGKKGDLKKVGTAISGNLGVGCDKPGGDREQRGTLLFQKIEESLQRGKRKGEFRLVREKIQTDGHLWS